MNKSIDFQIEMSSNQEDIQMADDADVDLYGDLSIVLLANDQPDVLDYFEELSGVEELSDLSGDEFSEAYSTKTQPAAPGDDTSDDDMSDNFEDSLLEDPAEARTQQPGSELELAEGEDNMLSFTEEELLEDYGTRSCQREKLENGQKTYFLNKIKDFEVDNFIFHTLMGNTILNIVEKEKQ